MTDHSQLSKPNSQADTVPPGYKRTEVGVIPEEWVVGDIGCHTSILTGGKNTQDRKENGSYPFFVRSQTVERIDSYSFEGEAVLTAGDGDGTGKIFHYVDGRFDVHQRVYQIFDFDDCLIGRYFFYQFSTRFYKRIMSMTAKSSVDSVRMDMIAKMPIPMPKRYEQRAIAEALSDVDGLIGGLERLIAKKRAVKKAAMQQLLTGKTRLPGWSGEWEKERLGNLAVIVMGQSPSSSNYNARGDGLPLIQGNADITNRRTIKRIFTTQIPKRGQAGDILMSVRAPVGEISRTGFDVCLGRGVCALRFPNDFLYHYLVFLEPTWAKHSSGSTFDSVNSADVKSLEIKMPSEVAEQQAIATVLSDMDAEIAALERRRDKTQQIKQGMMQQLLTGRVRLVTPQTQAAATQVEADGTGAKPHSWAFNEAVVISTLAKHFGKQDYPLGRKRYTKLSYLLHRHAEHKAEGYLKKAAGPYNPQTKYGGPEKIAQQNDYIQEHKGPKGHSGFIAADNIAQAEGYFEKWYGPETLQWLEQFRFKKNDDLELLATVDMAVEDLRSNGKSASVMAVKDVIRRHPEWKAKLDRPVFSDRNIAGAIEDNRKLFSEGVGSNVHADQI